MAPGASLALHTVDVAVDVSVLEPAPPGFLRLTPFNRPAGAPAQLHLQEVTAPPAGAAGLLVRGDLAVWRRGDGDYPYALWNRDRATPGRLETSVEVVLKVALADHLSRRGGLLLHASGWRKPEGAALFFGVSGAGKTTTVQLAPADEYLCDETMAVRAEGGGFEVYSTPFSGMDPRPTRPVVAPLVGLFSLQKAEREGWVRPLKQQDAVARLMRCVMLHGAGPKELRGALDTAAKLAAGGMVWELGLVRGCDPWGLIRGRK